MEDLWVFMVMGENGPELASRYVYKGTRQYMSLKARRISKRLGKPVRLLPMGLSEDVLQQVWEAHQDTEVSYECRR